MQRPLLRTYHDVIPPCNDILRLSWRVASLPLSRPGLLTCTFQILGCAFPRSVREQIHSHIPATTLRRGHERRTHYVEFMGGHKAVATASALDAFLSADSWRRKANRPLCLARALTNYAFFQLYHSLTLQSVVPVGRYGVDHLELMQSWHIDSGAEGGEFKDQSNGRSC